MAVTMIMVAMGMMETTVMVATGTVEANVMLEHMVLGLWVVMPEHMAMEHMVLGVAMPPKLWGTSSTTTSFVCIPVDDGNHSQLSLVTTIRLDVTETYTPYVWQGLPGELHITIHKYLFLFISV
jgi:hypothetical protein